MIDYLILSNTRSEKDYGMTSGLIESLEKTVYPESGEFSQHRITIVETNSANTGFVYPPYCHIVYFDMEKYGRFNYNYALNTGTGFCLRTFDDVQWICILNNDIICDSDWIVEIDKAVRGNPGIQSLCPNIREKRDGVIYGYTLFKHLDGCCIMHRASVLEKIGAWDESFDFAYQDDDYLERLRTFNICHAKVMSSHIRHLEHGTAEYTHEIGMRGINAFVRKWGNMVFVQRESEKHLAIKCIHKNSI